MDFRIREYKETDRETLKDCMEKLQDYIVSSDPLKRVRRAPEFGEEYTKWLLGVIQEQNGVIFLAEKNGKIIGCCAGMLPSESPAEQAGGIPAKHGRVQELYVDETYRGQGTGQSLMKKMEDYFRAKGCESVMVEVLAPNKSAYAFYQSCDYFDRDINMMKKL